jgi:hypothetical protein
MSTTPSINGEKAATNSNTNLHDVLVALVEIFLRWQTITPIGRDEAHTRLTDEREGQRLCPVHRLDLDAAGREEREVRRRGPVSPINETWACRRHAGASHASPALPCMQTPPQAVPIHRRKNTAPTLCGRLPTIGHRSRRRPAGGVGSEGYRDRSGVCGRVRACGKRAKKIELQRNRRRREQTQIDSK